LHETVEVTRWAGIALISFGVVLVSETPPHELSRRDGDSE
jgi:drug/metabolite transporter (DMT)-like permease